MKTKTIIWLLLLTSTVTLFHCSDDDHDPEGPPDEEPDKSDAKSITAFAFQALTPPVIGTVNESEKTVTLTVPPGTNRETLIPTIALSDKASVTPASGTAQDFTDPVQYTVTAEDGSQQAYTVSVSVAPYDPYECLPLVVAGIDSWGSLSISYYDNNTIRDIDHKDYDNNYQYNAVYWRTNDTLTRIEYSSEIGQLLWYTTLEYEEDGIIEKRYERSPVDGFDLVGKCRYFWRNDKIGGWTTTNDSAVYVYNDQGNLTRENTYHLPSGPTLTSYQVFEYDDKPNIYKITGAAGSTYRFFHGMNLSTNNIKQTAFYVIGDEGYIEPPMEFTYDAYDRPLTRRVHLGQGIITYAYECDPGQED